MIKFLNGSNEILFMCGNVQGVNRILSNAAGVNDIVIIVLFYIFKPPPFSRVND